MGSLIEARRRILLNQKNSDGRLWLVRDGVDIVKNTGGLECANIMVDTWGMAGWSSAMPVLSQGQGFLRLTISGDPVYGSLIPAHFFAVSDVDGKQLFFDASLHLSNRSFFSVCMQDENSIIYGNDRYIRKTSGFEREINTFPILKYPGDSFEFIRTPIQISARNTSYVDIYNMFIY